MLNGRLLVSGDTRYERKAGGLNYGVIYAQRRWRVGVLQWPFHSIVGVQMYHGEEIVESTCQTCAMFHGYGYQ